MDARDHSDSEDFRSVIDDLTVQNKKLRQKLKKYERLHCSHLQREKLFEVRIHGLEAHRKRELQDTLRNFASRTGEDLLGERNVFNAPPSMPIAPALHHEPSSSSTSNSRPLDSAYASMSGTAVIQPDTTINDSANAVTTCLQDIPEALTSKHPPTLSDKSKSKLIVRRLEQIFTGKGAVSCLHRQSHHQQEMSRPAAESDRRNVEACRQRNLQEGHREAYFLPIGGNLKVGTTQQTDGAAQRSCGSTERTEPSSCGLSLSRTPSPGLRPTRPLDLDLHRAQVPSDNLEYIRHLGLISASKGGSTTSDDDGGWMYLNLLISLAQLHTLNVTPEYVRQAVAEVSDKFELSLDGTKVKWLGGTDSTPMSSDGDESDEHMDCKASSKTSVSISKSGSLAQFSSRNALEQRPNSPLLVQASHLSFPPEIGAKRRPVHVASSNPLHLFPYEPLFYHTAISDEGEDLGIASDLVSSAGSMDFATNIDSNSKEVRERQTRLGGRKNESGPIIFYNRARFCTDLSGDPQGPVPDKVAYVRCTKRPVGCSQASLLADDSDNENDFSICNWPALPSPEIDGHSSSLIRSALDLEDLKSSISDCASDLNMLKSMEASGLGGVQPDDNFVVKVHMRHDAKRRPSTRFPPTSSPCHPASIVLHSVARADVNLLRERHPKPRSDPSQVPVKTEVISAVQTNMAPSPLPPPSYFRLSSGSSSSDDSSEDDEADNRNICHSKPTGHSIGSSADGENEESSYESDDSLSVDLLAHARILNPEVVRAQEMEFDSNQSNQPLSIQGSRTAATAPSTSSSRMKSDVDSMSVDGDDENGMSDSD